MRPVKISRISQPFANPDGYASRTDKHGPAGHHTGIDYGSLLPKTPIYTRKIHAVLSGEVVISSFNTTMGNWVGVYNHESDLLVTYWHMKRRSVSFGDWVLALHVLGRVGSTGNSTAPHLHLQVNRGRDFDYHGHINPRHALDIISREEARRVWKRQGGVHPNA